MSISSTLPPLSPAPSRRRPWLGEAAMLVVFLAIAFAVAGLGTVTTIGVVDGWYARSLHVAWTPPNGLFPIAWTILYTCIAVSGWLVWRRRRNVIVAPALVLFVVQLVCNALWTPVFFGGFPLPGIAALWIALGIILLLDLLVAATIAVFWPVSRAAAVLLVPYLAWILFASTLNWGDAVLNSLG